MDSDKLFWVVLGLLIFIFVVVIFARCNQEEHPEITIDGCEYVRGYNSLAHKGNCRQCEERLRKIIREEAKINEIR
jgi:hypothetical protein